MSEALFVPICVLGLWSLAHLLERPSLLAAGLFLTLVTARLRREAPGADLRPCRDGCGRFCLRGARSTTDLPSVGTGRSRRLVFGLVTLVAVLAAVGTSRGATRSAPTPTSPRAVRSRPHWLRVAWQSVALVFAMLVVPLGALAALAWAALERLPEAKGVTPFVAVAISWTVLVLIQSAVFATAYTGTAAGRYLVTTAPLGAIALCVWCARGAPCRSVAVGIALGAAALAVFVPVDTIAGADAFSANPFAAPLTWLVDDGHLGIARALLVGVALGAGALLAFARGSRLSVAVVVVLLGLVAVSASSYVRAASAASAERESTIGETDLAWIDAAAAGRPVAMLVTGGELWTGVTRTLFWNPGVRRVFALPGARSHPLVATPAEISSDGSVSVGGRQLGEGLVVTSSTVQLDGDLLAVSPGRGSATYPWRLWRASSPLRVLSNAELGVDPVGDMAGHARVVVPGCRPGALWITFLGKTPVSISVFVNGDLQRTLRLRPGDTPTESFPAPPSVDGTTSCTYDLDVPTLTGSTRLEYVSTG